MGNEIKKDIESTNGEYQKKFREKHKAYYSWLRQKKNGKTDKPYEEWIKTYVPYKR